MPGDKTDEVESPERNDTTPLEKDANEKPRQLEPKDTKAGTDLQSRGILPSTRIEVAPGVAVGDQVSLAGEKWTAKGAHEGKSILYQEGRGQDFAGELKIINGKPDPAQFKELPHFEGQPKGVSYYADQKGGVHKVSEMGDGKSVMSTSYDVRLADPKEIASKPNEVKAAQRADSRVVTDLNDFREVKVHIDGKEQTRYISKGPNPQAYELVERDGQKTMQPDKSFRPVSDMNDFKEVKVRIDGKEQTRYLSKGLNPQAYELIEAGGQKGLYPDKSFRPVSDMNDFKEVKVHIDGKEQTRYVSKGLNPQAFELIESGGQKGMYPDKSFRPVSDMNDFKEVKVQVGGKEQTRYVSKGRNPQAYELIEVDGKKALYRDHSIDATKASELATAQGKGSEKTGDKTQGRTPGAQPAEGAKFPGVGEQVGYKGEKLNVAGYEGNHALLQKAGRNSSYAVLAEQVTADELKSKYQELKVSIDGKETSRYIEKGHPEKGVFILSDFTGQKMLSKDHSFEVVPKSALAAKPDRTSAVERGASDKSPVNPAEKDKAPGGDATPDAALRKVKLADGNSADERMRVVDGKEVKVRTPEDKPWRREVEIDGKTVKLHREGEQPWFYSERTGRRGENPAEQVKVHVTGVSAEELVKLQKALLPELEKLRQNGDVKEYKTFDPNFMDGKWESHPDKYGSGPGPKDQLSKAFTIYVTPEKAQEVAKAIDKILKEKGLTLENFEGHNVGEKTRVQSESKRVSVERDMLPLTTDKFGKEGGLLDESLSKSLHDKYGKSHGLDREGRLTNEGLRAAEKAAGIARGQLTHDQDGHLMLLDANQSSKKQPSNRFYFDESEANKVKGTLTGRPALYALYEAEGIDPAKLHTDGAEARQRAALEKEQARPARVVPKAERVQGTDTKLGTDGTLDRKDARPGEVLAREQLERRERVEQKEIDAMKRSAEELAKSEKQADREKAEALKKTVAALEGRLGPEAEGAAHRAILTESRRALEKGEGGGYGKAVTGGLIGIGILTAAALAYYNSSRKAQEEKPIERAKVK